MARKRPTITVQFMLLLAVILVINTIIFSFMLQNVYLRELRAQAATVVANVEAFGSWVAQTGRVWVRDDDTSFLGQLEVVNASNPDEVIHFYSKNPALAQREFSETVAASASPATFRMTSTNVMNPGNAPDSFEQRALEAIGADELAEYFETVDAEYRYAKPVFHNASCIVCHGDPANAPADVLSRYGDQNGFGFRTGDLAGIISVTIPQRNVFTGAVSIFGAIEILAIIISVLVILFFVRRQIILPVQELTLVADKVSRGEEADLAMSNVDKSSANEIDQLKVATNRMHTSFKLSIRKVTETRKAAQQAIQVAKSLKAKYEPGKK